MTALDQAAALVHRVYCKTAKGQQEISERRFGLPARLRRVLILIDGSKSVGALAALLVGLEIIPAIHELEQAGFVSPAPGGPHSQHDRQAAAAATPVTHVAAAPAAAARPEPAAAPPPPVAHAPIPQITLSAHRIRMIRMLMEESCQLYLGIFGKDLLPEIRAIDDEKSLRGTLARWQIAMRESRQSDEQALALVDEIRTLLRA
ncbi:hypothetical protein [Chitinilyticum litopenaei]|uniref:hypothetical protein n=1 Tax=Chitinilyticum litopenaei TaxID=1121276 RepID=UPI000409B381|nr:hypothetical protein [Chitinilyticum litopenaei]